MFIEGDGHDAANKKSVKEKNGGQQTNWEKTKCLEIG